ncbi:hypothetical protein P7L91_09305 [Bisgaard Taxon 10/6]|uniref:hypothetical protein n=1 Tax=Exercitatus varius TaxID=67857 RepID=UPI00294B0FF1|nr:hypothetical protein [Exercitatus varius]MDG2961028.1 hypothetical protein [Exercitatus varius]
MELLPLDYYSLTQAVDFINQKTNSAIKENSLYSYAIEEKIQFLLKIEIKDNQLIKIGRNDAEGFFISDDSELFFPESAIDVGGDDFLILRDKFSYLEVSYDDLNKPKFESFKGYIALHPELLELFCKDSLPQKNLKNTNYLELESFTIETPVKADIWSVFNFKLQHSLHDEDERLYIKNTFRINFGDIRISYKDLIKLIPASPPSTFNDLEQEIKKLKSELEEKDKKITELQTALDDKNIPILLGVHREDDPLKIAIEVRNKYWTNYPDNVKSNTQIRGYIIRDYSVTQTLATEIEKIACPIDRKKN